MHTQKNPKKQIQTRMTLPPLFQTVSYLHYLNYSSIKVQIVNYLRVMRFFTVVFRNPMELTVLDTRRLYSVSLKDQNGEGIIGTFNTLAS